MRYNNIEKYSWHSENFVNTVQKQCQQTLHSDELCSISDKDNCARSENILSQTNIISKGFFQSEAQKALQNSEIDKAFEIAEQYIEISKRKFYRFLDIGTKKIIIFPVSTSRNRKNFLFVASIYCSAISNAFSIWEF